MSVRSTISAYVLKHVIDTLWKRDTEFLLYHRQFACLFPFARPLFKVQQDCKWNGKL